MMTRRSFLQPAGLAIAGGTATTGACLPAADSTSTARDESTDTETLLITSAGSQPCRTVADGLSGTWRVRLTGPGPTAGSYAFVQSDLGAGESTEAAVDGAAAVVHLALPPADLTGEQLIDFRTRGTYNLLRAAARRGVRQAIYLGSLAPLLGYDRRFMISEQWQPRPTPEPETLSHYLGEFTCREFARSGELDVVVLRCGQFSERAADAAADARLPGTRPSDLTAAIALALSQGRHGGEGRLGSWQVIHIHSETESTRFPLGQAERLLGYRPQPPVDAR